MQDFIKNTTCDNLVNYSNVSTSAENLLEVTPTESQDSLSFLMKNNVIINFSLIPNVVNDKDVITEKEEVNSILK